MEQYVLSLVGDSSTSYKMYKGATPLTDAELTSLFSTAGSAYFTFTFGSWTPSSTSTIQITNSSDLVVMENTGLTDTITEGKNYKGTWSANATTFDSFTELSGKALDESQLSFLMSKIKANTTALDDVAYVDDTIGTQTNEAYVGTNNIQDGAVTTAKIANLNITTDKIASGAVTSNKIDWETLATNFSSRVTANISLGNSQFIEIGNLRIVTVQTAQHTISDGETVITLNNIADIPDGSVVGTGVVQGTGASLSIVLYGKRTGNQGKIQVGTVSTIPSAANRIVFTLVWKV